MSSRVIRSLEDGCDLTPEAAPDTAARRRRRDESHTVDIKLWCERMRVICEKIKAMPKAAAPGTPR